MVPERPRERRPLEAFQWQALEDQANSTGLKTCRNSVQGKSLIADDKGLWTHDQRGAPFCPCRRVTVNVMKFELNPFMLK